MTQRQQEKGRLSNNPTLKDVAEIWLSSIEVPQVVADERGTWSRSWEIETAPTTYAVRAARR
ncbi:hypothetical protein ACFRJ9_17370 [Paenarthrobacter sp. NPDC056912]|uniref:hypothetical protein n=1 Tax=Paenarthrobacter sp. NPDC056912 TaxID=3345965 RepID=UPI00366FBA63